MSLLPTTKKYVRQPTSPQVVESEPHPNTLMSVLEAEESHLINELLGIHEAKNREPNLRNRLNVVQQSLQAFRALDVAPEPVQEQQLECLPIPQEKRIRKATTAKTVKPTPRSIAPEPVVSDTEGIELVHDDFATFPE